MGASDVPPPPDPRTLPAPSSAGALPTAEALIGLAVFVAAAFSVQLTHVPGGITFFWPANGIAAAALIRLPKVRWLAAAGFIALAFVLVNVVLFHRPWLIALMFTGANGVEVALMMAAFRLLWVFPYPNITIGQAVAMTAVSGVA